MVRLLENNIGELKNPLVNKKPTIRERERKRAVYVVKVTKKFKVAIILRKN